MRLLVAGVGNVLHGDDGFGVAVAERLLGKRAPDGVKVIEVGIGGIHMVQELFDGYDALIVVDAVDVGKKPGTVVVIDPDVEDVRDMSATRRRDQLADMHYAVPERALMLARGMGILPPQVFVVGGQAADPERYGQGLCAELEKAVDIAVEEVKSIARAVGVNWT